MGNRTDAKKYFERATAEHQMTVLHDDGVYRHLHFGKPGTGNAHFNVVTYPGTLVYTGDMGDFVFQRLNDMFDFFRTDSGRGDGINPGYWAEKLVAIDRGGFKEFDHERFTRVVMEYLIGWIRDYKDQTSKEERRELWEAVVNDVINADSDRDGARKQIAAHDFYHDVALESGEKYRFEFHDFWEHDLENYTFHFYWACYAIAWAVQQYDLANTPAAAVPA